MPKDSSISGTEQPKGPAFVFDLDGTLVDSVYQHVLAWQEALEATGKRSSATTLSSHRARYWLTFPRSMHRLK